MHISQWSHKRSYLNWIQTDGMLKEKTQNSNINSNNNIEKTLSFFYRIALKKRSERTVWSNSVWWRTERWMSATTKVKKKELKWMDTNSKWKRKIKKKLIMKKNLHFIWNSNLFGFVLFLFFFFFSLEKMSPPLVIQLLLV